MPVHLSLRYGTGPSTHTAALSLSLSTAACLSLGAYALARWLQQQQQQAAGPTLDRASKRDHGSRSGIGDGDEEHAGTPRYTRSPRTSGALAGLSAAGLAALPYPPDALPGGRDVATPYGAVRVYEWGPAEGEPVLLLHGISTPCIALGDLAYELVARGCRVMLFDLFGRGYSDAPRDVPYDSRLYTTQMLLVLASSPRPWDRFHLVGYSLGGGLAAAFARYLPQRVTSLVLVAGSGLIRADRHVGWRGRLLYDWDVLPGWLVRRLVRGRIRPATTTTTVTATASSSSSSSVATASPAPDTPPTAFAAATWDVDVDIARAESGIQQQAQLQQKNADASGGAEFDRAGVSRRWRPGVSVSAVVAWQVDHHAGFVPAFISTMRHAPIYAPSADWAVLGDLLARRRGGETGTGREGGQGGGRQEQQHRVGDGTNEVDDNKPASGTGGIRDLGLSAGLDIRMGLVRGKVLLILGRDDPVVVPDETVEDAEEMLGRDGVEAVILNAGHELPMTIADQVANYIHHFIG